MTLQAHEIYAIEKYLLEQDLISLEFYEEMLDHFIDSIATYKSKGNDFETSFILTRTAFSEASHQTFGGLITYKGLKALEMQHYDKLDKKFRKASYWAPLNLFKAKEGIPWLIGFLLYLSYGFRFGGEGLYFVVLIVLVVLLSRFFYYSYMAKIVDYQFTFLRWYRFMITSFAKRKQLQLKPNYQLYLLLKRIQKAFVGIAGFMYLGFRHMTQKAEPFGLNIYTGQLVMAFLFLLIVADHFIHFKKEYDKTLLEKA
ncbi:hypothetical protein SAMN06298216_1568 [Spirosomataceae bacterium TFI 002]|nr:hypothetical protein SAMN06298216_1568 [Spirosomataceae bacterium TFI 002]